MIPSPDLIQIVSGEILQQFDPDNRLARYFDLLTDENSRINLVSRETLPDGLPQLAAESLLPFRFVEPRRFANYLDIGSGGGFPAFPILITQAPDKAVLVERTQKKATALERFARDEMLVLKTNIKLVGTTFEDWKSNELFDLITLRLVRLTPALLKKIIPRLTPDGLLIYYATPGLAGYSEHLTIETHRYAAGQSDIVKSFTFIRKK